MKSKKIIIYHFIIISLYLFSCQFVAFIDPPKKSDFFNGKYNFENYHGFDSNIVFIGRDNEKLSTYYLLESDGIKIYLALLGGVDSIQDSSVFKIYICDSFKKARNEVIRSNYGYKVNLKNDSFRIEVINRYSPGIFIFYNFIGTKFSIQSDSINMSLSLKNYKSSKKTIIPKGTITFKKYKIEKNSY